jgi:hypothetical protein
MSSSLHLISGRNQYLQLARPGTQSSVPFFEPLTGKPMVHQETLNLALKVHPVLFRRKTTQDRASSVLLTQFEKGTFLPPTQQFFRERPELITQVVDVMDSRFGTVKNILEAQAVNDYFQNLIRTILHATVRRSHGLIPLVNPSLI